MDIGAKNKIINQASDLFFQFGPSRVTMEEIADKLGMSKKTLYKFFTSKDELLSTVIEQFQCTMSDTIMPLINAALQADAERFATTMSQVADQVSANINNMQSLQMFRDLQRNYPLVWKQFEAQRREMIMASFKPVLLEGVEKKVFRSDLNYDVFMLIYLNAVEYLMNPMMMAELPHTPGDVYKMLISILFDGVLTETGRAVSPHYTFNVQKNGHNSAINGSQHNHAKSHTNGQAKKNDAPFWEYLVEVM